MVEYLILGFLAFVFIAHMPIIPLIRLMKIDVPNKFDIIKCFIGAWLKNILTIIPDLLAPVVVPIALLFTKYEDNKLPKLFEWWDNDASINGDGWAVVRNGNWVRVTGNHLLSETPIQYGDPNYTGDAYYCEGHHPRSFYARWVWLGLRNRASRLSQILGYKHDKNDKVERWSEGTPTLNDYWTFTKVNNKFRYYEELPVGGGYYLRLHYGYKVPQYEDRPAAPLVAIGFSLRKQKY